jgi:hypothetical protein
MLIEVSGQPAYHHPQQNIHFLNFKSGIINAMHMQLRGRLNINKQLSAKTTNVVRPAPMMTI